MSPEYPAPAIVANWDPFACTKVVYGDVGRPCGAKLTPPTSPSLTLSQGVDSDVWLCPQHGAQQALVTFAPWPEDADPPALDPVRSVFQRVNPDMVALTEDFNGMRNTLLALSGNQCTWRWVWSPHVATLAGRMAEVVFLYPEGSVGSEAARWADNGDTLVHTFDEPYKVASDDVQVAPETFPSSVTVTLRADYDGTPREIVIDPADNGDLRWEPYSRGEASGMKIFEGDTLVAQFAPGVVTAIVRSSNLRGA